MTSFVLLAALMLIVALAFVLTPLLRTKAARGSSSGETRKLLAVLESARQGGLLSESEYATKRAELGQRALDELDQRKPVRTQTAFYSALLIALLLPATTILMYRSIGTPAALQPGAETNPAAPTDHGNNIEQAITSLAAKLKKNPGDTQGWALLGRAYEATRQFDKARDALKHAYDQTKGDPDITVAYAEAMALSSQSRRIEGEPRKLIDAALKAAPDNNRGLWLLGISEYQQAHYDKAIAAWKHLLRVVPKDSDIVDSVKKQIAQAEAVRDGKATPAPDNAASTVSTAPAQAQPAPGNVAASPSGSPQLTVEVSLDPKLKSKLSPNDVLFVYAKAASGPPMPLAIQRMPASKLPVTVTLTDGMGMVPSMTLSKFKQVIIGARVSKSGNAMPHSGDLQVLSKPLAVTTSKPIKLDIDQVVN